jgi:membrane associated rhomboid family serine protease
MFPERRKIAMNQSTRTRIVAVVAGSIFFGVAMGARDLFDNIWIRAAVAAVGAVGGIAILGVCHKRSA